MSTFELSDEYELVNPGCGCEKFAMPKSTVARWRRQRTRWHCPTCGDGRVFTGKTKEEKQLEQARLELAQVRSAQRQAEHEAKQNARRYRRIRTRVQNGVCPCCNRTFQNLARHMATQHPERMINERLRHLRTQYGLTQQDLADEIGVSAGSVSVFERGQSEVSDWMREQFTAWVEAQGETA